MSDWMEARHRVALAGLVVDAVAGKPIAGARVEITSKPAAYEKKLAMIEANLSKLGQKLEMPDATRTRPDGLFYFLDLPEGDYKLVAFVPNQSIRARSAHRKGQDTFQARGDKRYGKAQVDAKVTYRPDALRKLPVLRLQPTGVMGRVMTSANKGAVLMAEVRMKGSGERTFTDGQGQYVLTGIQPNERAERILQVRARGYKEQAVPVLIDKPGTCKKLDDIRLAREG